MLYRAVLQQFTPNGVMIEIPILGAGQVFGPCQVIPNLDLETGQDIVVSTVDEIKDDIIVLGPLTSETIEYFINGNDSGEGYYAPELPGDTVVTPPSGGGGDDTPPDTTPPPSPSNPVVTPKLGGFIATWDGLDYNGNPMPSDFAWVGVFANGQYAGFLLAAGSVSWTALSTSTTYAITFVAYDKTGNASNPSPGSPTPEAPAQVTTADIAPHAVTASLIANNTVTATQIAPTTITAAQIAPSTITATQIQSGTITTTQLSATAINGMTITGATIRTGSRTSFSDSLAGVYISSTGQISANSSANVPFFTMDPNATNQLVIGSTSGNNISYATSTGKLTLTGSFASNPGSGSSVRIDASETTSWFPSSQIGIYLDTGTTSFNPGYLSMALDNTLAPRGSVFLQGGGSAPTDDPGNSAGLVLGPQSFALSQGSGAYLNGIFLNSSAMSVGVNSLTVNSIGPLTLQSSGDSVTSPDPGIVYINGGNIRLTANNAQIGLNATYITTNQNPIRYGYGTSTTNAANLFMQTSGAYEIRVVSSGAKYKAGIQNLTQSEGILNLSPREWYDKGEADRYADAYGDEAKLAELAEVEPDPFKLIPGVVAEEVHDAGLERFVNYDADGNPDSVMYDRLWITLIPIIKKQQGQIEDLQQQLSKLQK